MYKIMIVDDEILVRVGLKATIQWESLGFSLVAEASNGEQALEIFHDLHPDVVLTDIKMPKMDGLSLARQIREIDPSVKIVILSAHDEFQLAREALNLGVFRYILKSEVEDEDMTELLVEIRVTLDRERQKGASDPGHDQQVGEADKGKGNLLASLLGLSDPSTDLLKQSMNLSGSDQRRQYILILMQEDLPIPSNDPTAASLMHLMDDVLKDQPWTYLTTRMHDCFALFLAGESINIGRCRLAITQIKAAARRYLNVTLSTVIGEPFDNFRQVREQFKALENFLRVLFYQGQDADIDTHHALPIRLHDTSLLDNTVRKVIDRLDVLDIDGANTAIGDLVSQVSRQTFYPLQVKLLFINIKNELSENYFPLLQDQHVLDDLANMSQSILDSRRISQVSELILTCLDSIFDQLKTHRIHNAKGIVQRAKNLISDQIDRPLSLESIAGQINVSKQYLCSLFKKETGENLTNYINQVRIAKAKELIRHYDYRTKDLYDLVGFSDPQYFSKIFKKVTGKTVVEYRNEIESFKDS